MVDTLTRQSRGNERNLLVIVERLKLEDSHEGEQSESGLINCLISDVNWRLKSHE